MNKPRNGLAGHPKKRASTNQERAPMARFKKKLKRRAATQNWPMDHGVQLVIPLDDSFRGLDDDCPICRELREAGEPVFTFDAFGNLVPLGDAPGRTGTDGN
jgi:hypothetical protein